MNEYTRDPARLTVDHIATLARSLSDGDPIDPKALAAALVEIVDALSALLHAAQHTFQVVNPDCDGPDDCPLRDPSVAQV